MSQQTNIIGDSEHRGQFPVNPIEKARSVLKGLKEQEIRDRISAKKQENLEDKVDPATINTNVPLPLNYDPNQLVTPYSHPDEFFLLKGVIGVLPSKKSSSSTVDSVSVYPDMFVSKKLYLFGESYFETKAKLLDVNAQMLSLLQYNSLLNQLLVKREIFDINGLPMKQHVRQLEESIWYNTKSREELIDCNFFNCTDPGSSRLVVHYPNYHQLTQFKNYMVKYLRDDLYKSGGQIIQINFESWIGENHDFFGLPTNISGGGDLTFITPSADCVTTYGFESKKLDCEYNPRFKSSTTGVRLAYIVPKEKPKPKFYGGSISA